MSTVMTIETGEMVNQEGADTVGLVFCIYTEDGVATSRLLPTEAEQFVVRANVVLQEMYRKMS